MPILQFPKKEPHMVKAEMRSIIQKGGFEPAHLDDIVHDAASSLASDANNGGTEAQVAFLLDTCGWTPQDILNALEIQDES